MLDRNSRNSTPRRHGALPDVAPRRPLLAALLASPVLALAASGVARAQQDPAWRGLSVPRYPNAADTQVMTDGDEYKMRFRSDDGVQAVFDFYRGFLDRQGFRVTDSRPTRHGFKAEMVRGQGGPADSVELDVKRKNGRYKVEIEFDE